MRLRFFLPAALLFASSTLIARADTVTLSYDTPPGPGHASGNGSFSYNGPLASIDLAELSSFSFNVSLNNGGTGFNYDLADLTSFSATVTDGEVTALSLETIFVPVTFGDSAPQQFVVTGLGDGGAHLAFAVTQDFIQIDEIGSVTTSGPGLPATLTTPEPSSFLLLGTGLLSVAAAMRRRLA